MHKLFPLYYSHRLKMIILVLLLNQSDVIGFYQRLRFLVTGARASDVAQ